MKGYFDHNATTPLVPAAREAWIEAADRFWHNPSSLYREAGRARRMLEEAREELADGLGCESPDRIVFTSGATEGNHGVMRHAAAERPAGRAWVSSIEHPSVHEPARREFGPGRVREIPVTPEGVADRDWLEEAIRGGERPALVSVMAANNETGVLQPWREFAARCGSAGIPFHTDASQWVGKRPARGLGEACDWITGCAHKFGGPKGTGFLVIPESAVGQLRTLAGGPQEGGHRAGTEDLPGILAMMAALRTKPDPDLQSGEAAWSADRQAFEEAILARLPGSRLVGSRTARLWNTSLVVLPGTESNLKWVTRLSARGFAVSTGSACSAGRGAPSRVLGAMGLDFDAMGKVLRFSGGWETALQDWLSLAEALVAVGADLSAPRGSSQNQAG